MSSAKGAGILPSYQRFVQPGQLFARRSFRPREKYLIFLVFLTFGIVCFGAFFFLPDDFKADTNSVYRVYQRMQKAGPELLIPAPPRSRDDDDFESNNGIPVHHHGEPGDEDVHLIEDKQKLQVSTFIISISLNSSKFFHFNIFRVGVNWASSFNLCVLIFKAYAFDLTLRIEHSLALFLAPPARLSWFSFICV